MNPGSLAMKKTIRSCMAAFLLATLGTSICAAEDDKPDDGKFDVSRYRIEGNTLLPAAQVESLVLPFAGPRRDYGDIQRALEALENAYRKAGYNTVTVYVPEQELNLGEVKLLVSEGVIGKVTVTGNKHFSTANVRAGLPALKEGTAPNARQLSENIQLSNDNPAKQVEVILGVSEEEGKVDAKITVTEEDPLKLSFTLDNTGSAATGKHRVGVAVQEANLFKLDHTLTLAYTTSPDAPSDVKVDIFSLAYHLPFYGLGDSIDLIYGKSSVDTPSVQATGFGLTGKGDVFALRYNHYFPRRGEYSAKLIFGFDYKYFNTRCSINGIPQSFEPPLPAISSCTPHTSRPVSVAYSGQKQGASAMTDYNLSIAYNLPLGSLYLFDGAFDRYSLIAGRPSKDNFSVLRFNLNYLTSLATDWQGRVAFALQYAPTGLIPGEQFGLAGASAVRGFTERAVAADSGQMVNLEIYTPDLASAAGIPGNMRGVLFFDAARGSNHGVLAPTPNEVGIAAFGFGLRYNYKKDVNFRADLAQVVKAGPPGTESRGDWRGHFNMALSF